MLLFWCFFQVFLVGSLCKAEISCLNEEGQPVDWFIVYKLPIYKNGDVGSGVDYMYLDPSLPNWQKSNYVVNTTDGALARTLNQLYRRYKSDTSAYLLYNDAPPVLKYENNYGHTKGVLMFDQSQGFWLTHSIPHFPPFPEMGFGYPSTGKLYGQTVQCMTYSYKQFQIIYVTILTQICASKPLSMAPRRRLEKLVSVKGEIFFSFAKSHNYVEDIYTDWVAQTLSTDLLVETWQRKAHQLPSNCSLPYHVLNVKRVILPGPVIFNSHEDHSKWSASWKYKDQWNCVGDLNRETGQAWRGGGLICTQNPSIYKAFRRAVSWYKSC